MEVITDDCQEALLMSTTQALEDAPEDTGILLHHRVSPQKDSDLTDTPQGCQIQRTKLQPGWISELMVLR